MATPERFVSLVRRYAVPTIVTALAITAVVLVVSFTLGCSTGRTAFGGAVVGFEVGQPMPESTEEALRGVVGGVAGMLPPPFGQLAALAGTGVLGIFAAQRNGAAREAQARAELEKKRGKDLVAVARAANVAPAPAPEPTDAADPRREG